MVFVVIRAVLVWLQFAELKRHTAPSLAEHTSEFTLERMKRLPLPVVPCFVLVAWLPWPTTVLVPSGATAALESNDDFTAKGH
jgi:hypothetical protein